MKAKVDAIAAHGMNCFVNRQLIYKYPQSLLTEKGIMVIEHADFEGVESCCSSLGVKLQAPSTDRIWSSSGSASRLRRS